MKRVAVLAVLVLSCAFLSAGTFTVVNPGPANSTDIRTFIYNNDGWDLLRVIFDLSGTTSNAAGNPPLTFGGTFGEAGPAGGTYAGFGAIGGSSFGYDFTGFNHGESFEFNWDPDLATDPFYGATVDELDGMVVTLVTSGGTVSGVMHLNARSGNVSAVIGSPVPEPATLLLLGSGLIGVCRKLRRKA